MTKLIPWGCVIDTETGGLNPNKHSLLTAHFILVSKSLDFISELGLCIKYDDYVVSAHALDINRINGKMQDLEGVSVDDAKMTLFCWLHEQCKPLMIGGEIQKDKKLKPIGQNIPFDIAFCKVGLCDDFHKWETYFSHHFLDTAVAGGIAQLRGELPEDLSLSLQSQCEFHGIETGRAHTAKDDSHATFQLFKKQVFGA
jgi:DNA polymerase-3 subunit epsilon